jgi:hypothetical protein
MNEISNVYLNSMSSSNKYINTKLAFTKFRKKEKKGQRTRARSWFIRNCLECGRLPINDHIMYQ